MPGCSAFGCKNRTESGHKMKIFPKDPARRKLWVVKVNRANPNNTKQMWIPTPRSHLCHVSTFLSLLLRFVQLSENSLIFIIKYKYYIFQILRYTEIQSNIAKHFVRVKPGFLLVLKPQKTCS